MNLLLAIVILFTLWLVARYLIRRQRHFWRVLRARSMRAQMDKLRIEIGVRLLPVLQDVARELRNDIQ